MDAMPGVAIAPRETRSPHKPAKLSTTEFENPQLSLFQGFLSNQEEEREQFSNAIDFWDSVPRYSLSRDAQRKERDNDKTLDKHTAVFHYRGRTYSRTITPARVTDLDGKERDYYPSVTEEVVEDALRKLATEQQAGYFDRPNYRSGVVFSLYALREELAKRGHTRSYQEIRMALDILSGTIIEITSTDKGEAVAKSPYLPSLVAVSRTRLNSDPNAKWAVQFHPFVTESIDKITYRQFNYALMMSHDSQLARWLHKYLVLKYTFADVLKPFEIRYSTVKRDSGLLDRYTRERDAINALQTALEDLRKRDILSSSERNDVTGPRKKIIDAVFTIRPSFDFIKEVKAANKRLQIAGEKTARSR